MHASIHDSCESPRSNTQQRHREDDQHRRIGRHTEMRLVEECRAQVIDAVGQRVEPCQQREDTWQVVQRVKASRQKEQWHDHEIHDPLKCLHFLHSNISLRGEIMPREAKVPRPAQDPQRPRPGDMPLPAGHARVDLTRSAVSGTFSYLTSTCAVTA